MLAPQQLQHEFRAREMGATFVALQKFLDTPHVATRHFRQSRASAAWRIEACSEGTFE
jgi:hypothetical protein